MEGLLKKIATKVIMLMVSKTLNPDVAQVVNTDNRIWYSVMAGASQQQKETQTPHTN